MKVFTRLFSIYLLMLWCMPCNDGDECNRFLPAQASVSAATHDNHRHDRESCTPFCTCSCCAAAIASPAKVHFQTVRLAFPLCPYPVDKFLYTSRVLASIWQPPRFS